jgi:hypothetical protein
VKGEPFPEQLLRTDLAHLVKRMGFPAAAYLIERDMRDVRVIPGGLVYIWTAECLGDNVKRDAARDGAVIVSGR